MIAITLSDEAGKYRFINLKPGKYQVRCYTLNGYVYYNLYQAPNPMIWMKKAEADESPISSPGDILHVEQGRKLSGVDFRFPPFKKGTWKTYTSLEGLENTWIRSSYQGPDGLMWFGTHTGVFRFDGKEFDHIGPSSDVAPQRVCAIHRAPDGVMWFGTGDWSGQGGGVSRYDGGPHRKQGTLSTLPPKTG